MPGRADRYHLVAFDAAGNERPEAGSPYSRELAALLAREAPTDVFVLSHGWNGDMPAARRQYGAWIAAMAECPEDRAAAEARPGGFCPAVVGIHWPSKAWGDEDLGSTSHALPADVSTPEAGQGDGVTRLLNSSATALGDTPIIRDSVCTIVDSALDDPVPVALPARVREAYQQLDAELGLGAAGEGASPGDDRASFDPEAVYQACLVEELASFGGTSLGGLLAPLRVLTFWHMKRRARDVGVAGVATLLTRLQDAAPGARFHLMGHSFGCIVVSSAVAGRGPAGRRPVFSLALVQGAMSLWSFCSTIPSAPERPGYFHRVLADGLITGPIVVTTSVHDRAVRTFYPLGAGSRSQVDYLPDQLPTYGAIGTFGVRGPGIEVVDDDLRPIDEPYDLEPGVVHDLRGDDVIRDSAGVMGAHSDITKPPVAHAVWQAALAAPPPWARCRD
ncbi:hypothetical protein JOD57_002029 [Geodermatophilus bullaregiensis]|uniref:hypothetical protein n=1 Tax=Geodermatophilus bullaregiensis TaxID=1564160 RepID=UPI00195E7CD5|nr:hypothetical protein [Geodermatophilus bullaregiensis]MBM7806192.1 hypothetical protein [Geodermatophilus bullaregiensis]